MKEKYFTAETLEESLSEMSGELEVLQRARTARLIPIRSALLVLDMQGYFLETASHAYVPSAAAVIPGIQALIAAYARRDLTVIFTQHLNTPQDAGRMADWWRDLIRPGDPLSAITSSLDTAAGRVITKFQYDAFYRTELENILHNRRVSQVVVCGVMTHLCCETTARSAFVRGFEVFFPIDGSATYQRDFHRATLLNLAHGFATITTVRELLAEMKVADGA